MSNCVAYTLAGLVQDCETSKGGIKKVFIATEDPKPTYDESTGMITGFNDVEWFEYNFKKNTSSMTSTLNVDQASGTNYVSTELVLQFNKMNTVKRIEMQGLAVNDMYVIVQDSNNKYWYLGYNEAVVASSGSGETGTAKTDGNKYTITLTDESDTWPYEVKEDALPKQKPIIRGWSGLTLDSVIRDDNAFTIEGEIKQGATVTLTLSSHIFFQQRSFYDKDTGELIGEQYDKTVQLTLDKTDTNIYNIASIGQ